MFAGYLVDRCSTPKTLKAIAAVQGATATPARLIGRPELGTLRPNTVAGTLRGGVDVSR